MRITSPPSNVAGSVSRRTSRNFRDLLGQALGFGAARLGSHARHDRDFIQHQHRIFDEHAIGAIAGSGQRNDAGAEFGEACFIRAMLRDSFVDINRLAVEMFQLAVTERGADGSCNRGKHLSYATYWRYCGASSDHR